jgi:hypothetical protein
MQRHLVTVIVAFLLVPALASAAEGDVTVSNFPKVQPIEGTVTVKEIVSHVPSTRFLALEQKIVPPLGSFQKLEPRSMTFVGLVDAEGFASAVASVAAWLPQPRKTGGRFGMLLVPDVAPVRTAIDRDGSTPFAWRVEASLESDAETVVATSDPQRLAFPVWRAYLYNTTSTALAVNAYLMLGD